MISLKAFGVAETVLRLRSIGERVGDSNRKVMHAGAARIVKLAKLMTPVDTYQLEDSIEASANRNGTRGRLQIDITVGPALDDAGMEYAAYVHENYNDESPGPKTIRKQARNPDIQIGREFLTRAADAEQERFTPRLIEAMNVIIREEDK